MVPTDLFRGTTQEILEIHWLTHKARHRYRGGGACQVPERRRTGKGEREREEDGGRSEVRSVFLCSWDVDTLLHFAFHPVVLPDPDPDALLLLFFIGGTRIAKLHFRSIIPSHAMFDDPLLYIFHIRGIFVCNQCLCARSSKIYWK